MVRIKVVLFFIVMILTLSCKSVEQQTVKTNEQKAIGNYTERLELKGFSGTILIEKSGIVIHHKGYGFRDKSQNLLNEPNTVFDIGSVTKQFTGAGIMKLVMDGQLSLDDQISKFFDDVPDDKKQITIHHLLTHASGLLDAIGDDYETISEKAFVKSVFSSDLISPVGEEHHYSNVGYSLLAIIIEKTSGLGYEAYLNEKIFAPSDMYQTGYVLPDWDEKNIAKGYSKGVTFKRPNEENWDVDGPYLNLKGNGGLLSNGSDLLKWSKAIKNNSVLNKQATESYLFPHILEYEDGGSFYGYGWVIDKGKNGSKLIWHNGGNGIFFADMWMFPEDDMTIIVLSNKSDPYVDRIAEDLAEILFKTK